MSTRVGAGSSKVVEAVGRIAELARFPVKSMQGEALASVQLGSAGFAGDRCWAVRDLVTGELTSAKRFPRLLQCKARYVTEDSPHVLLTLPDGSTVESASDSASERLSAALKHDVALEPLAPKSDGRHYRLAKLRSPADLRRLLGVRKGGPLPDMAQLPLSLLFELALYATPRGTYFDAFPLHLITTNALAALSSASGVEAHSARFRANLVVQADTEPGYPELDWCGARLLVGDAEIAIQAATFRCGMPAHAQGELPKAPDIVRTIYGSLDSKFGIYAQVLRPGTVRLGDRVVLSRAEVSPWSSAVARLGTSVKRGLLDAYLSL